MTKENRWVFVDCEGNFKPSPATGRMTEFGAVHFLTKETFHGLDDSQSTFILFDNWLHQFREMKDERLQTLTFWTDNIAYDWQWINYGFDKWGIDNPFGYSARRIGDFYSGLINDVNDHTSWKKLRITTHDHNPVHDAMGNVEAFERLLKGDRPRR